MNQIMEKVEKQPQRKPRATKTAITAEFELAGDTLSLFRELLKTYKDAIGDELPIEFHEEKMMVRCMDASRIKMANFTFYKGMFEEWDVTNKTEYKPAPLPASIKVSVSDLIYALDVDRKDAKARFYITAVFASQSSWTKVEVRKPNSCPKCGLPTNSNEYSLSKRKVKVTKRGTIERYKCSCGWRGKVRTYERKEKVMEVSISNESSMTIEVIEPQISKETYKVKIFKGEKTEALLVPKFHFDAQFKLLAKEFKAKLNRLRGRTDRFKMTGSREGLVLAGKDDTIDVSIKIGVGSDTILTVDADGESSAIYSLDQVLSILPKTSTQIIGISYSTDMPIRLTWEIDTDCSIEWYVAPCIENY